MKDCVIIIPVYIEYKNLSLFEKNTIDNCINVIGDTYDIMLCTYESLNIKDYPIKKYIYFDKEYFISGVEGYNKLMLSLKFYKRINEYGYTWVLIHLLDSWLFRNDILHFIKLDYDYYGAPWKNEWWLKEPSKGVCGNGGLTLRKINKIILFLDKFGSLRKLENEDVFISLTENNGLNICPDTVGCTFSIETNLDYYYSLNNKQLPMGCHNPFPWDRDKFWFSKGFSSKGYLINYKNIYINPTGRLGNELCLIFTVFSYLKYHDYAFTHINFTAEPYEELKKILYDNNISYLICTYNDIPENTKRIIYLYGDILDQFNAYEDVFSATEQPNIYFDGYMLDSRCFNVEFLQKIIKCPETIKSKIFAEYNNIENSLAIHVRRGDYLEYSDIFYVLEKPFIKYVYDTYFNNMPIIIISDDIQWCKQNLNDIATNVQYSENHSPIYDLFLLSFSKSTICSNSTFSIIGSLLTRNKTSVIGYPFFKKNNLKNTIIPENFIKISHNCYTEYKDKLNLPFEEIYCLHLAEATDREQQYKKEFSKLNIEDKVKIWWTCKRDVSNIVGEHFAKLWEGFSYLKESNPNVFGNFFNITFEEYTIIKTAYLRGVQRLLLMEDDIVFVDNIDYIKYIFNNIPEDFDIIRLLDTYQCNPTYTPKEGLPLFIDMSLMPTLGCSALCVGYSRKGMKYYIDYIDKHFDVADAPFFNFDNELGNQLKYYVPNYKLICYGKGKSYNI